MYDFEKRAMRDCWRKGWIENAWGWECPLYRITKSAEPQYLITLLAQEMAKEPEIVRHEYIVETIIGDSLERLFDTAAETRSLLESRVTLRSLVLARLDMLLQDSEFFCQLEAYDFAAAADRGRMLDKDDDNG